jgi:hypothetical protein
LAARLRVVVPGVLVALAVSVVASPAHADTPGTDITSADSVSVQIEKADKTGTGERAVRPVGTSQGHKGVSAGVVADLPAGASGRVTVTSRTSSRSVSVGLPLAAAGSAKVAASGAVVYSDTGRSAAAGVRVFDSGVQIATVLGSASSPRSFSYPLTLPAGAHIQSLDKGGLVFVSADGNALGGFAAPWATDANGKTVATTYQVQGNTVVQQVQTDASTAYPVVADPYLWIDLISSASWSYHSGYGWTLEVTPTTWARAQAGSYLVGTYDWNELYSKYKNSGLNTNLNGMRDQLICHQVVVAVVSPTKATWNLDEWRPDVGYVQTVNSRCNPGGSVIWD